MCGIKLQYYQFIFMTDATMVPLKTEQMQNAVRM
jgi:hypothetical protein